MPEQDSSLITLTSSIVSAHISNNHIDVEQLPALIRNVYAALANAQTPVVESTQEPAVGIKQSVRQDSIVCLDCGGVFKMLKRHLNTEHGMTPAEYRAKWHLPSTYPVVSPNYATTRSKLAKKIGLGRVRAASSTAVAMRKGQRGRKKAA
jgi:predicted transcriptional regulator